MSGRPRVLLGRRLIPAYERLRKTEATLDGVPAAVSNSVGYLGRAKYLLLESERANGKCVATPIWFVVVDDSVFVRTEVGSAKVRRISRQPVVRVAACNVRGVPYRDRYYIVCLARVVAPDREASQTQGGQTVGFNLDPAGRTRETVSTGTKTSDLLSNYAGPGSSPSWSENKPNGETTRNIPGINGQLAAIQYNAEPPTLQLANLHGDIIATAYLSETATELESKSDTSEFGVPTNGLPPKYSWLGAIEVQTTELPSGVISMGARSYVPQLGRFLQPDPVPGGSANAYTYTYTFGDPVNSSDPSGDYTASYVNAFDEEWAAGASERQAVRVAREEAERRAAEEAAARVAAEQAAQQAALAAEAAAGPQYGEEEEWEEWWEEEGWEEYASYKQGGEHSKPEAHLETGVLYQPLLEVGSEGEAEVKAARRLCLDAAGGAGKMEACARYASIFSKIGHWVDRHIIKPVEHAVREIVDNLPKCYTYEIEGGGQCSSAPPGEPDDPFFPLY
jgi:PPOX class probable F420-dependent enzyme